jgi:hypothetical protein
MTSVTSKDTANFTAADPLNLTEPKTVRAASTREKPTCVEASGSKEAQIEAGKAFMARYKQTFVGLAK